MSDTEKKYLMAAATSINPPHWQSIAIIEGEGYDDLFQRALPEYLAYVRSSIGLQYAVIFHALDKPLSELAWKPTEEAGL